ncbi:MAG: alpha/beta hydrolase [Chloroflexota bacterium]
MSHPTQEIIYKTIGETELMIYLFTPPEHRTNGQTHPAILFFHGGGFVKGHPNQFFPQCTHYAAKGFVTATAQYRFLNQGEHGASGLGDCLADAKSAVRWVRAHADELGIDSDRLVVSGGSAGGNLAANCAVAEGYDHADDDMSISCKPNAMVLFNPGVFQSTRRSSPIPDDFNPSKHIHAGWPPSLILHGTEDELFPLAGMQAFCEAVVAAGNQCELAIFEGEHGFFNYGRDENRAYEATVARMDQFLEAWLAG